MNPGKDWCEMSIIVADAGPSDLVHFVVKIVVEKASSEKNFMLVTFLWYINLSVLFLEKPQNISNSDSD